MLPVMRIIDSCLLLLGVSFLLAACPLTPSSPDAGIADGGPSDAGSASRDFCDADAGPVPTAVTGDITYAEVETHPCLADACLCDDGARAFTGSLLACEPVRGGYYWAQGSATLVVVGSESGDCLIDVAREVEGGMVMLRCRLPLPLSPWPGLATNGETAAAPNLLLGIEDRCTQTGSCNLQLGAPSYCGDLEDPPFNCADVGGTLPCGPS